METQASGARARASAPRRSSRLRGAVGLYQAVTHWSLYVLFLLVPLFFLPWNIDILEVNKQTLLVIITCVAVLAWLGGMITGKRFVFHKGWLNLMPFVLLVSVLISTVFSLGGFISWVGEATQEYMSFLSTAAFVVIFYLVANTAGEAKVLKNIFFSFLIGAGLTILIGTLSMLGVQIIPFSFAATTSFNTVGTLNSLGIFAIFATIFGNGMWLVARGGNDDILFPGWRGVLSKVIIGLISLMSIVILAGLDYWVLWVVLLFGLLILFAFSLLRAQEFPDTQRFIIPMALFVVALLLMFLATPLRLNVPAEVTPSLGASWSIATQTLSDTSALFGSGPGTFIYDYAKYHSVEVNQSDFWDVRFDRSSSHVLTMMASLGVLGLLLWVLFVAILGYQILGRLLKEKDHAKWKTAFVLFAPWAALVLAAVLYSSNFTLTFLFFAFAGLLASQAMTKVKDATVSESPRLGLLFSFLFVLVAVVVVSVLFVTGQRYVAEVSFAQAVKADRAGGELTEIVTKLDRAATFNSYNDIYYRNLAQALLLRVSEELASTEELTSERASLIRALTAASINAAKRSTDLAPNNVLNWRVRGSIYREVIPYISGADQFAKESFEKAIELDPVNPINYTELARVYIVIAETARQLTTSTDEETAANAQMTVDESLAQAEEALNKVVDELKPDYAPAHYQLAIVYERQGRLDDAVARMEGVALLNQFDVGVAFQLGLLYLRQGETDKAQTAFEYAIQLVPTYSNARWFLASIYESNGEIDLAIEQVEKVLEANPDNELVKTRLDQLHNGVTSDELPEPVESGEDTATDVSEGEVIAEEEVAVE